VKRIFCLFLAVLITSLMSISTSYAAVKQGGKCPTINKVTTVKSGSTSKTFKCLIDYYGEKTWTLQKPVPASKSLENSKSATERLRALNNLGLGSWRQVDNEGFSAQVFMSSWPCRIYIATNLESAVKIYDNKVNLNFYGGFWVGIKSQSWVVDQPSMSDRSCVQYFARKYGGRIYNGNTQNWDG
jgi:exopolysaccharide biosynthesis protein